MAGEASQAQARRLPRNLAPAVPRSSRPVANPGSALLSEAVAGEAKADGTALSSSSLPNTTGRSSASQPVLQRRNAVVGAVPQLKGWAPTPSPPVIRTNHAMTNLRKLPETVPGSTSPQSRAAIRERPTFATAGFGQFSSSNESSENGDGPASTDLDDSDSEDCKCPRDEHGNRIIMPVVRLRPGFRFKSHVTLESLYGDDFCPRHTPKLTAPEVRSRFGFRRKAPLTLEDLRAGFDRITVRPGRQGQKSSSQPQGYRRLDS
ncbi:hypothetical protein BGX29_010154 [Mortierella sp. GBA35]|nr:hypothetical protein BGX29_010154 [Mortierella sp. GBA35]